MAASEALSASLEDYLETIFHLVIEKQFARAKDISKRLGVNNSSVTNALQALAERKLINYAPYEVITMTTKGKRIAKDVVRRHEALKDFFTKVLAIPETEAEDAACKMEHAISRTVLERLIQFAEFVERCPRGGNKWIKGFGYFCNEGDLRESCENCVTLCLDEINEKKKRRKSNAGEVTMSLNDLEPTERAKVLKVKCRGEMKKRITDMGILPGCLVEVERVAPLGDPIMIKARGYHLTLRKEEAAGIMVEKL